MKIEKIKPIPKYILALIEKADTGRNIKPCGLVRYFSYLTKNDGELMKITCAVKVYKSKWYCKQVAVHGVHSAECFVRDLEYSYMGGYRVGFYHEGMRQTTIPKWFEDGKWYKTEDKYYNPFSRLVNPEYAYKYPEYKYSACDLYKGDDIIKYLRIYEQYPQAEMLVKFGLSQYVESKQILEKVGKDKHFRKWISANLTDLQTSHFHIPTIFSAYKGNKPLKETRAYDEAKKSLCKHHHLAPIREMLNGDYKPYFDYVSKQNITNQLYLDYLNACLYLGLDMSEDKNRYPHDFKHWHDIRIDEYTTAKALKDQEERKELYSKFTAVSEKYLPMTKVSKGGYVAIIATSPSDLIKEGEALHHCVGRMGYDQKFVREESLIFFIRSAEDITKPLVTIEYSVKSKKILQCYADHNSKPDEAVTTYINTVWLPYANRQLTKISA